MDPESRRLSFPQEHVDAAEDLEALAVELAGGWDHLLDDCGTACVANFDDDNVLEFRGRYTPRECLSQE
jgi:hypothetical protein